MSQTAETAAGFSKVWTVLAQVEMMQQNSSSQMFALAPVCCILTKKGLEGSNLLFPTHVEGCKLLLRVIKGVSGQNLTLAKQDGT